MTRQGILNIPDAYTSKSSVFGFCADGTTAAMTSVQRQPDGAFRVFLVVPAGNDLVGRADLHFRLLAF